MVEFAPHFGFRILFHEGTDQIDALGRAVRVQDDIVLNQAHLGHAEEPARKIDAMAQRLKHAACP